LKTKWEHDKEKKRLNVIGSAQQHGAQVYNRREIKILGYLEHGDYFSIIFIPFSFLIFPSIILFIFLFYFSTINHNG
jgi:hypothetical protein